jgi:hypothetical protein
LLGGTADRLRAGHRGGSERLHPAAVAGPAVALHRPGDPPARLVLAGERLGADDRRGSARRRVRRRQDSGAGQRQRHHPDLRASDGRRHRVRFGHCRPDRGGHRSGRVRARRSVASGCVGCRDCAGRAPDEDGRSADRQRRHRRDGRAGAQHCRGHHRRGVGVPGHPGTGVGVGRRDRAGLGGRIAPAPTTTPNGPAGQTAARRGRPGLGPDAVPSVRSRRPCRPRPRLRR